MYSYIIHVYDSLCYSINVHSYDVCIGERGRVTECDDTACYKTLWITQIVRYRGKLLPPHVIYVVDCSSLLNYACGKHFFASELLENLESINDSPVFNNSLQGLVHSLDYSWRCSKLLSVLSSQNSIYVRKVNRFCFIILFWQRVTNAYTQRKRSIGSFFKD